MIVLISTCEPSRLRLVPQFISHYRAQGVERFLLSLQIEPTLADAEVQRARAAAAALAESLNIPPLRELHVKFDAMSLRRHHDWIQFTECYPSDWIVWADIDEFHMFGGDLRCLAESWKRAGFNAARGAFVDRIARDGRLPPFDPSRSIWAQYPVGCNLTREIAGGLTTKVTIARQFVRIEHGNHSPVSPGRTAWALDGMPIFHFKWDAAVVPRLRLRLTEDWKSRCWWWTQSDAVLTAISEHGGRIPMHKLILVDYGDDHVPATTDAAEVIARYSANPILAYASAFGTLRSGHQVSSQQAARYSWAYMRSLPRRLVRCWTSWKSLMLTGGNSGDRLPNRND
jgi:hypothetical protein